MKNIKAVLFDLDGTLINTLDDLAGSVNYVLNCHGYPTHAVKEYRYFVGNGARLMIRRALPEAVQNDETVERLLPEFLEHYGVHSKDHAAPYDGIKNMLNAMKKKGLLMAVITNKPDSAAQHLINEMFPKIFDYVTGQRDGVPTKPAPDMPLAAMSALNVKPENCIFVGDSGVDIQTGANSGACAVGVLWGFRDEKELRDNGAKYIVSRPDELVGLLNEEDGI